MASKTEPIMDGVAALEAVLRDAGYRTTMHAVAAHAVFLHPDTVAQAMGKALFPVIRNMSKRGTPGEIAADPETGTPVRKIFHDDNRTPTDCFLWAANRKRGPDVQYNHIWMCSDDPDAYTALWNLCVTPAFLAKTTDGKNHREVVAALQRRSFDLYGNLPPGGAEPVAPEGYDTLTWAEHPSPVESLEKEIRARLQAGPKSPAATVARTIGWLFSDFEPDASIPG